MKQIKNINGLFLEIDENGERRVVQGPAEGSGRIYWAVLRPDGEMVALHEGREGKLTAELVIHNHKDDGEDFLCIELTAEEYAGAKADMEAGVISGAGFPKMGGVKDKDIEAEIRSGKYRRKMESGQLEECRFKTEEELEAECTAREAERIIRAREEKQAREAEARTRLEELTRAALKAQDN